MFGVLCRNKEIKIRQVLCRKHVAAVAAAEEGPRLHLRAEVLPGVQCSAIFLYHGGSSVTLR